MPEVVLQGITKYFGDTCAVNDVDLVVEDGSFHTLLGPSGCGKSTTLRMIAGLETPSSGRIMIGGKFVYSYDDGVFIPPAKRDVGLIFQDYALWPHMTVFDNVKFGLEVQRIPKPQIKERVSRVLKRVDLDGFEERYPSELSGGQQQRVAMVRMLVVEPSILLFDEPLSNLDARLRLSLRSEMKRLHTEIGATSIYVTHDQREALALSDLITVMNNGRPQQTAAPFELYDEPANLFVASFVGSPPMNMLRGTICEDSGKQIGVTLDNGTHLDFDLERPVQAGKTVVVGVRPEDVSLSAGRGNGMRGVVVTVEPAGSETFVVLLVGDLQLTARIERTEEFEKNSSAGITFKLSRIYLFDAATGERLR